MKFSFYTDDVTKLSCGLLGILVFEEQIGEGTIFNEPYRREFPRSGPRDAADMAAPQFRQLFLGAVAADLARIFTAYPSEQRAVHRSNPADASCVRPSSVRSVTRAFSRRGLDATGAIRVPPAGYAG